MNNHSNTLVTVDEAAEILGLQSARIRQWIHREHIKRHGTRDLPLARPRTLVDIEELREFIKVRGKSTACPY